MKRRFFPLMVKCFARALACIVSIVFLQSGRDAVRAEENLLTWTIFYAAPFMITAGPDVDQGIFDSVRLLLEHRLEGYAFKTLPAPFPRVLSGIKDGLHWCFIGGVETPERDAFAVFSLPVAMQYPLTITVHATRKDRFAAMAPLSLQTITRDPALRTSSLQKRSFGPAIDAILRASAKVNPQFAAGEGFSEYDEAYKMLIADRLDYLIGVSASAQYAARQIGAEGQLVTFPFVEAPEPTLNRVMCPKNDWGRQIVDRIDAVLRSERQMPDYRRIVEKWSDAAAVQQIRAQYDSFFLKAE